MKKILIIAASVLCSAAVYVGVNSYANNSQMDLLTQNIEALTRGETPPEIDCKIQEKSSCTQTVTLSDGSWATIEIEDMIKD